jgi:hypothetical protein
MSDDSASGQGYWLHVETPDEGDDGTLGRKIVTLTYEDGGLAALAADLPRLRPDLLEALDAACSASA